MTTTSSHEYDLFSTEDDIDFGSGTFEANSIPLLEGSVEALLDSIEAGPNKFTKETNEDCARLLSHRDLNESELPGNLRCFNSYNGIFYANFVTAMHLRFLTHERFRSLLTEGLRCHFNYYNHKSTRMWLFKKDSSTPLKGVKVPSGLVAEWDPGFSLGLAIVAPSGQATSDDENVHALKMHFCGRRNRIKNSNVIFLHSEKSRTDKRIKARCYFRIRIRAMAVPDPTAKATKSRMGVQSVATETMSMNDEQNIELPAMGTSFFNFVRQQKTYIPWLQLGPHSNDCLAHIIGSFQISQAIQSIFSESSTNCASNGSYFTADNEYVILESAASHNSLTSFARLSFEFVKNVPLKSAMYIMAKAFFDGESLAFFRGIAADVGNSNFVLENTFRYMHDKTLVVILGILILSTTDASNVSFPGDKLIFVAKQLPTSGEWKAFFVGGTSLMPIGEETSRGLIPSFELSPLAATDQEAVQQAGANLLLRSNTLTEDDVVILSSSRCAIADDLNHRELPVLATCISGGNIDVSTGMKYASSLGMSHYSQSAKKRNARLASDAPHFVFEDILQLQLTTTKYAKSNAEQLMRVEEGTLGLQLATISSTSVAAPPSPEARSHVVKAPTAGSSMSIAETSDALKAKLQEVASLELAAKAHPEGSAVHTVLLEGAKKAKIEADQIMNTVNI